MGFFDRLKDTSQIPPKKVVEGGSHGSHWNSIIDSEFMIKQKMMESTQNGLQWGLTHWKGFNVEHKKEMENDTFGLMSSDTNLRIVSLHTNKSLWSAYPVPTALSTYPVKVKEIHQWKNLIEGWLSVEVCGAGLNIFDTGFFKHMGNIKMDNIIHFSAIAYAVKKAEPWTIDARGQQFNNKGSSIILPYEKGSMDDYNIQMPIAKVEEINLWGNRGYQFVGPLIRENGSASPFVIPIIAAEKAVKGPVPQSGDDLSGIIWLQGFIKNK